MISLKKKKINKSDIPQVFSDKVIGFINESSMWRSFGKNTFVDDVDIQLVRSRFDGILIVLFLEAILCIVLVFQKIEAYNLVHLLMIAPHWPLNSKELQFIILIKKYIKLYFAWDVGFRVLKLQTHFSQNMLFIYCDIFSEIINYLFAS